MSDLHHELQRHATGLRDLARDLLRDAHAAEDVTQATMQQALAQRDLQPGPLGGWLHRTLVNFARQWRRRERRRTAREGGLPAATAAPSVAEQLARRETLQRVTSAVLTLEEPYQTAVFLRYFEDLPPRTIAARTATNVATVKSRLARGLVMLRARLDHHDTRTDADGRKPWRAAVATTFGLPVLGTLWPIPTGTLLVSTTTKAVIAVAAACLGGVLVYHFADEPAPLQVNRTAAADDAATKAAATSLPAEDAAATRTAVAPVATEVPWLEHPYEVGLDVLVVDSLGLPIENHQLELAPFACAWNKANASTGPDGRVALTWHTRQRSVDVQLVDPRGQTRRVTLQHGSRTRLTLLGRRRQSGVFTVELSRKMNTTTAFLVGDRLRADRVTVLGSLTESLFQGNGASLVMQAGLHPAAVFGDPLALVAPKEPAEAGPNLRLTFDVGDSTIALSETVRVLGKAAAVPVGASITGVVFGNDGKPAAKVPLALLGTSPQPLQRSESDDQGHFQFSNLQSGEFTVRGGGDHQGLATVSAKVTEGATPCTLNLQRGACIHGRAVDDAGRPRGEHTVEWRALDGSWADATRTEKDGTFVFANLPAGPGALFLFAREGNMSIPIATAASVLPDTGDVVLTAPIDSGSVLRVEPPSTAEGQSAPTILAWHADTGLAITIPAPEKGAVWSSSKLPSGFYDVEMRLAGAGSRPLGRHWLDGEHDFDLGRVEAPRSGSIRITIPAANLPANSEQLALEVCALRSDVDVRIEPSPLPLDRSIRLPVGDYVLAYRHADGGVRFHRFAVVADEEAVVTPAP